MNRCLTLWEKKGHRLLNDQLLTKRTQSEDKRSGSEPRVTDNL